MEVWQNTTYLYAPNCTAEAKQGNLLSGLKLKSKCKTGTVISHVADLLNWRNKSFN